MTVDTATPIQLHTIAGTGPYGTNWPYAPGAITAFVVLPDGALLPLASPGDFTVSPLSSTTAGNVTLDAAFATTHAGRQLVLERATMDEQGWVGSLSARERGLEGQLDAIVMGMQELRSRSRRSLRSTTDIAAFAPGGDGSTLMWQGNTIVPGPTAADILAATPAAAIATAAAAAAATFDPALYLPKSGGAMTGLITGTAVQSSPTDTGAGKLMPVGAFGLGAAVGAQLLDLDSFTTRGGSYWTTTGVAGTKPPGSTFQAVVVTPSAVTGNIVQTATDLLTPFGRSWRVGISGVWSAWRGANVLLSEVQAKSPVSDVEGLISGRRLAQSRAWTELTRTAATTSGVKTTVAHGLGAIPAETRVSLLCVTAQSPYALGEVVQAPRISFGGGGGAQTYGVGVSANATNVIIRTGFNGLYLHADAGGFITLTPANWKFIVEVKA